MHVLLTNDDGYLSEGFRALARALIDAGHRVTPCAPDRERSAASHALSVASALTAKPIEVEGARGYAIDGTPADCARLGLYLTRDDPPEFAISGINRGPNLGGACIYSGTVNAAMEASMAGCPALAASLRSFHSNDFEAAARVTLRVMDWARAHPLERGEVYNLNVPCLPYADIKGVIRADKLAPVFLSSARYEVFVSEYNHAYYFLIDGEPSAPFPPDSDDKLNEAGWATLTALTWNIARARGIDEPDIKLT